MIQYLIILLDDTSVSFCHYENTKNERRLIPLDMLEQGIRFGMMENLMIQFVFPNYELPEKYQKSIESIDHSKIKPIKDGADVWVTNELKGVSSNIPVVLRIDKDNLFAYENEISDSLGMSPRVNIVLTDVESFTSKDFDRYDSFLCKLSKILEKLYVEGKSPQLNLLTDRMMLTKMNNCGAGETTITVAPNGKFYVCPAFYYENEENCIGDLGHGLYIKNKQLYCLDHAPICRHCDAWQCKRCIWLNRKTTLEVNTPSHEQCVLAHIERNTSRNLLNNIRKHGTFLPEQGEIKQIEYLDPFDMREKW